MRKILFVVAVLAVVVLGGREVATAQENGTVPQNAVWLPIVKNDLVFPRLCPYIAEVGEPADGAVVNKEDDYVFEYELYDRDGELIASYEYPELTPWAVPVKIEFYTECDFTKDYFTETYLGSGPGGGGREVFNFDEFPTGRYCWIAYPYCYRGQGTTLGIPTEIREIFVEE